MRVFGQNYRGLYLGDKALGILYWPSIYALAYAAAGNPAVAFGGLVLSFVAWPQYFHLRTLPCFWILASAILASRTNKNWAWVACGFAVPLALCCGVEFAAYGTGAALIALLTARGPRARHLLHATVGAVLSGSLMALFLARAGVLGAFVRTTLLFLPTLLPAYAQPLVRPAMPASLGLGSIVAFLADRTMFLYVMIAIAIVGVAACVARAPVVGSRARVTVPLFAFLLLAMLSVIERRHINYPFFMVPLALVLALRWLRGRRPGFHWRAVAAGGALATAILVWRPWLLLSAEARMLAGERTDPGLVTLERPERARGALFSAPDVALVRATEELIRVAGFSADDTWLDFANAPGLYYLFNRNCPIRYYEVPYYETPAAQAEVIAAIERNARVRAVLIADGLPSEPIDGVANALRAPRVAQYLNENFHPFFRRGAVVFWLRNSPGGISQRPRVEVVADGNSLERVASAPGVDDFGVAGVAALSRSTASIPERRR